MFKLFAVVLFISTTIFPNDCLSIKDSLDREYCFKKALRAKQNEYDKLITKYKTGISKKEKDDNIQKIETEILMSNEETSYLAKKKTILISYKEKLAALDLKVSSPAKDKKENKLKNSLKKFGIKL